MLWLYDVDDPVYILLYEPPFVLHSNSYVEALELDPQEIEALKPTLIGLGTERLDGVVGAWCTVPVSLRVQPLVPPEFFARTSYFTLLYDESI